MDHDPTPLGERDPRDTVRRLHELADDARADAALGRDGPEQAPPPGSYPPGLGVNDAPAVHRADDIRRRDDIRTADRQEEVAESQARAAELLERNARLLERTGAELRAVSERVRDGREDVEAIRDTAADLDDGLRQSAEQVRDTPVPDADR
ncbi:MAG TPA: hypothetical protein VF625_00935 [Longimicrobium sp.]